MIRTSASSAERGDDPVRPGTVVRGQTPGSPWGADSGCSAQMVFRLRP